MMIVALSLLIRAIVNIKIQTSNIGIEK
jgi:hypothetical protein